MERIRVGGDGVDLFLAYVCRFKLDVHYGIHVIQHMLSCPLIRIKYRDIIFRRNYSHIVCSGTSSAYEE